MQCSVVRPIHENRENEYPSPHHKVHTPTPLPTHGTILLLPRTCAHIRGSRSMVPWVSKSTQRPTQSRRVGLCHPVHPTFIRFMVSHSCSSWWADARASSCMSVSLRSFSWSSCFSCDTASSRLPPTMQSDFIILY